MSEPEPEGLSTDDLKRVSELLYRWTGIVFGEKKRYFIERRIADRMRRSGAVDVRSYLARIVNDGEERQSLINTVTVNETYFYREDISSPH